MKYLLLKLGHVKSVIIITFFSIITSTLITYLILHALDMSEIMGVGLFISTVTPLIVAPLVITSLNNLLFKTFDLEAKMRVLASTDYLTQLLNRGEWMNQVEHYIELASHSNSSFAIIMIDLDDFKTINDRYGHLIGDRALRLFGEAITTVCRTSDIAARFGGEEFIILLPNTSKQQAVQVTERLHQQTKDLVIMDRGNIITLTVSIGIGISVNEPNTSVTLDTLISRADLALYQAKNEGKNRTILFQS